jgi:predicted permease
MRHALRSVRRRPVFAAAAILTVALGIGANTALFGVVYAVLLRPLPFREPALLVEIWQTHPALPQLQVTVPDYEDFRTQAHSFESVAAYTLSAMNGGTLLGQGAPEYVHATMASADLFPAMGIRPLVGRVFSAAEDRNPVAVLSESLWRRKFGADPNVAGRMIRIDSQEFRVVGVLPQRQAFPAWADLWIPLGLIESDLATRRKYHPLELMARLKPGVTVDEAQAEIQALAKRAAAAHPDTNAIIGAYVVPLAAETTRTIRPPLLLAWAAVGLVLLMACANLAHLFLARLSERRQELAVRRALGAGPWRLARQVLAECLVVAALGGVLGALAAAAASRAAGRAAARLIPQFDSTGFGAPVWLFAMAVTLAGGVLFALPVCWQVWRPSPLAGSRIARSRLSPALIGAEVAMALLVLAGAAMLTRSLAAILDENPGFRAEQVWVVPNLPLRRNFADASGFLAHRLLPAVRSVPGVEEAAAVNAAPLGLARSEYSRFATRFGVEDKTYRSGGFPVAQTRWVTPEYFQTLGIPLRSGRWLAESDAASGRILISETLARRYFPGQNPVGRHVVLGVMGAQQSKPEVVGVVGDVRDFGLDREVEPTFYGLGAGPTMTVVAKCASPAGLRAAIQGVDPEMAVPEAQPLQKSVDDSLAARRFILTLLVAFAAIAAFLTAAGLYALMAQSVSGRIREFGVRAAVGAGPAALVRMVLREWCCWRCREWP